MQAAWDRDRVTLELREKSHWWKALSKATVSADLLLKNLKKTFKKKKKLLQSASRCHFCFLFFSSILNTASTLTDFWCRSVMEHEAMHTQKGDPSCCYTLPLSFIFNHVPVQQPGFALQHTYFEDLFQKAGKRGEMCHEMQQMLGCWGNPLKWKGLLSAHTEVFSLIFALHAIWCIFSSLVSSCNFIVALPDSNWAEGFVARVSQTMAESLRKEEWVCQKWLWID